MVKRLGQRCRPVLLPGTSDPRGILPAGNCLVSAAVAGHLTAWTVVSYLAARGLLTPEESAWWPPRVTTRAGRSMVFRVRGRSSRWIVKQALDEQTRRDQRREAAMYWHLASAGTGRDMTPRLVCVDPGRAVLVLEDFPLHRALSEFRLESIPLDVWDALGTRLAELHRQPLPSFGIEPPWILSLDRPSPSILRFAGSGQLLLLTRIQGSAVWRHGLGTLRSRWRPVAATHGDLRLDNVLLRLSEGAPDLRLVDLELAGPGDPAADVGWVVGDLLARSIDAPGGIASVVDATRCLWRGYARATMPAAHACEDVVRWAAARILLEANERLEYCSRLDPVPTRLLECAESAMAHPGMFARDLFGDPNP